jgi:hypothetical protein
MSRLCLGVKGGVLHCVRLPTSTGGPRRWGGALQKDLGDLRRDSLQKTLEKSMLRGLYSLVVGLGASPPCSITPGCSWSTWSLGVATSAAAGSFKAGADGAGWSLTGDFGGGCCSCSSCCCCRCRCCC